MPGFPRMGGWPRRFDPYMEAEVDEYAQQFSAPTRPDGAMPWAGQRQSENVVDVRGQYTPSFHRPAWWNGNSETPPEQDNRHTQAVDRLVDRLHAYAPSRAQFLAPKTIKPETAVEMGAYYDPIKARYDKEAQEEERIASILRMTEASILPGP